MAIAAYPWAPAMLAEQVACFAPGYNAAASAARSRRSRAAHGQNALMPRHERCSGLGIDAAHAGARTVPGRAGGLAADAWCWPAAFPSLLLSCGHWRPEFPLPSLALALRPVLEACRGKQARGHHTPLQAGCTTKRQHITLFVRTFILYPHAPGLLASHGVTEPSIARCPGPTGARRRLRHDGRRALI